MTNVNDGSETDRTFSQSDRLRRRGTLGSFPLTVCLLVLSHSIAFSSERAVEYQWIKAQVQSLVEAEIRAANAANPGPLFVIPTTSPADLAKQITNDAADFANELTDYLMKRKDTSFGPTKTEFGYQRAVQGLVPVTVRV